jgi:2-amino-4-hydroxy-6-hydroxymethyldihydropteridine diphosphokinase
VVTAYIGLGANLADPAAHVRAALASIERLPQTTLLARSSFYRTAPIGIVDQPDFINAVCSVETTLSSVALLQSLMGIEQAHGRVREKQGGPRRIDLDLLLYGTEQTHGEALVLPHPRMHERAFVLLPLCEIAPTVEIPGRGAARALLAACGGQRVERLEN